MGIAGSIVDHNFFELAGMKVQAVDMTELRRRIDDQKIYDETELEMALAWADKTSAMAKMKTRNSINAMLNKAAQFCAKVC